MMRRCHNSNRAFFGLLNHIYVSEIMRFKVLDRLAQFMPSNGLSNGVHCDGMLVTSWKVILPMQSF